MKRNRKIVQVQIPGATEHIAIARNAVDAVGEQLRLPRSARDDVKLAVGEACNNAVQYGQRPGAPPSPLVVACRVAPDALEIEVSNRGKRFQPKRGARMPPAEDLGEHGRGRALMEMLMDSVEYLSDNNGTVVRMRKKRPTGDGV